MDTFEQMHHEIGEKRTRIAQLEKQIKKYDDLLRVQKVVNMTQSQMIKALTEKCEVLDKLLLDVGF